MSGDRFHFVSRRQMLQKGSFSLMNCFFCLMKCFLSYEVVSVSGRFFMSHQFLFVSASFFLTHEPSHELLIPFCPLSSAIAIGIGKCLLFRTKKNLKIIPIFFCRMIGGSILHKVSKSCVIRSIRAQRNDIIN